MGWNDHLPDPDAWEDHVEALADQADNARKTRVEAMSREEFDSRWNCPLCQPGQPCDKHKQE